MMSCRVHLGVACARCRAVARSLRLPKRHCIHSPRASPRSTRPPCKPPWDEVRMMRVPALVLAATVLAAALPSMPGSARSDPVPGEITLERELALSGGSRAPETRAAAVADFNEDGLLDIASLGGSATSSILLLLGDNEHEFARSLPVSSDAPSDRDRGGRLR